MEFKIERGALLRKLEGLPDDSTVVPDEHAKVRQGRGSMEQGPILTMGLSELVRLKSVPPIEPSFGFFGNFGCWF